MRIWLLLGVLLLTFGACVPNRKIVYLQNDDLKRRKEIPKDTILRSHPLNIREYHIQPLDVLSINFETLEKDDDHQSFISRLSTRSSGSGSSSGSGTMLNGVIVDVNGDIEYAILGKVHVVGMTLFQAQDTLRKITSQFVPDVIVRVRMLNFRFTVLGEVNGEGTTSSNNTRLTMMEAIGLAGGLSELADRSHVKIVRQNGAQADIFYVDLLKEDYIESPYYYVQQNDVIIVPPLKQRPFRRYFVGNLGVISAALSFVLLIATLNNR